MDELTLVLANHRTQNHELEYFKWSTARGTLLKAMWQPGCERVWGRLDTRIWTDVSFCCPSETITTSLVNWLYPSTKSKIQKKKKKNYELETPFQELFVAHLLNVERLTPPGSSR